MDTKSKILVIDDEPLIRMSIFDAFSSKGYTVLTAEDSPHGIDLFKKELPDIVITDIRLPSGDGLQILKTVKDMSPDTGVILVTAYGEVKTAVKAIKEGAFDYLTKPFSMEELILLVERFLKYQRLEAENIRLKQEVSEKRDSYNIIGKGAAMQRVFEFIETVAPTDSSVLIYGETGVGKELVANAIHNLSHRKDGPFIKINCAAIPETLLESEIFGHEKGAFTGAIQQKKGKMEAAHGGTILFDEIGDMSLSIQAKLLRVLETKEFDRVGGNRTVKVDTRTIFATRKNLKEEVNNGNFREDLYYRINVVPVTIPPLRERKEDIPLLIDHFLRHYCRIMDKPLLELSPEAASMFMVYDYPGNVRELQHAIETIVTLCRDERIELKHLPIEIQREGKGIERGTPFQPGSLPMDKPLAECVKEVERQRITYVLKSVDGRKQEAARILGITRKSLWQKMKGLNIPS